MPHSIWQQIWKTQQGPQDWKKSVFIPIPKKGNTKEYSNYTDAVLISDASKVSSKSFMPSFSSTWTENFLMYKLGFKKAEESEIKLPTLAGSWRKQGSSRKTCTSASLTTLKPLTVWITTNWKIPKEMGVPDHLIYLLRNLYMGQEATVRTGPGTYYWFPIGKWVLWTEVRDVRPKIRAFVPRRKNRATQ